MSPTVKAIVYVRHISRGEALGVRLAGDHICRHLEVHQRGTSEARHTSSHCEHRGLPF